MPRRPKGSPKPIAKTAARMSRRAALTPDQLKKLDAYWRASNYLAACQLYLLDNPLLKEPLEPAHIKKKIVGHWGTVPGQNFIYTHLNRVINRYDLNMIYLSGPGHGGNAMVAQTYLEGTYSEVYPNISQDEAGLKKLFKQFSFPGGIPSHVAPETPGSIHEGGELGYSLAHAFGAVFDNPGLIAACVVGDGEAETGPLATSWHGNKFLNPATDGAVLPILHLNGYKIANPTIFSRVSHEEVEDFFKGCGWTPRFVEGDDPAQMHQTMAAALDWAVRELERIQHNARQEGDATRPRWPMIVFRSPKGWTCPKEVDGQSVEGTFRAHQLPLSMDAQLPARGALRRAGRAPARAPGAGAPRRPPHGGQPPRQRRAAAAGAAHPRLQGLRRARPRPRRGGGGGHGPAGQVRAGRGAPQRGFRQLPHLRPGRDPVQPPGPGL